MLKERSKQHKLNQDAYAELLCELVSGPTDCYELAEVSGLHIKTVQDLMRTFKRKKLVHIVGWHPNSRGSDTTPVFEWGKGKDKPRRMKTRAEIAKAYRARKAARELVNCVSQNVKIKEAEKTIQA